MSGNQEHDMTDKNKKLFLIAFIATFGFAIVEFVFGIISRSVLVATDALHMLSDAGSLFLGLIAVYIGSKVATNVMNFGFKRFETIAAFINGLTLIVIPLYVIYMSVKRFIEPQEILSTQMLVIGIIGLLVNLFVAYILSKGEKDNLNLKAAALHVLGDLLTSVTVIFSSLLIMYFDWVWVDPFFSVITSLYIMKGGYSVTKESFRILMESVPVDVDYTKLHKELSDVSFVQGIKELRVWTLSGNDHYAILKIVTNNGYNIDELRSIFDKYHIHPTIEIVLTNK